MPLDATILRDLATLTRREPQREHIEELQRQARADGNDRGAAILIAANFENVLELAIIRRLGVGNRPDSTFGKKIEKAQHLGIIGPQTRHNLDMVREIRNAFAHSMIPITFETAPIAAACREFTMPVRLPPFAVPILLAPLPGDAEYRRKYERVCEDTSNNLWAALMTASGAHGTPPSLP
jgi:Domain of unknown function (DUF4145)